MNNRRSTSGWGPDSKFRHGKPGEKGDKGELHVQSYCKEKGLLHEDLNDVHSQCVLKVDAKIDGKLVDVKTNVFGDFPHDMHFVEMVSHKGSEGWAVSSSAEEIWAVNKDTDDIFVYPLGEMRDYLKDRSLRRASRKETNKALGVYLPLTKCKFVKHLVK